MLGNIQYNENLSLPLYNQHKTIAQPNVASAVIPSNSHQKVDDILAVASEQVGLNNAQNFCETPADDALDKLSSLDLGLNSSDLDVNLSGITLDSFSESAGLNFSLSLGDGKNSEDRVHYQDNLKLQDRGNCT